MKQCRVADCTNPATVFVKIDNPKPIRIYVCAWCKAFIERDSDLKESVNA